MNTLKDASLEYNRLIQCTAIKNVLKENIWSLLGLMNNGSDKQVFSGWISPKVIVQATVQIGAAY